VQERTFARNYSPINGAHSNRTATFEQEKEYLMPANIENSHWERIFVGKLLCTLGVVLLSLGLAIGSMALKDFSPEVRTASGLGIAVLIGIAGEFFARRSNENSIIANSWFTTAAIASAYGLAYFFTYATYYVPWLHGLDTPYWCWALGLLLGFVGTVHGVYNKSLRGITSAYTLAVTGHFMYQVVTSTAVVSIAHHDINVSALGCLIGMVWCGALSVYFKRRELKVTAWAQCTTTAEKATWLLYRVSNKVYFGFAALCAMAVPYYLGRFSEAPIWWSLLAPLLLAISWRSGNEVKHGFVALMWAAAAGILVTTPFNGALPMWSIASVVGMGGVMAAAYRLPQTNATLPASFAQPLKVAGYAIYTYGAIVVALLVPYLQVGYWDSMSYWIVEALVICGLGILARDGIVHKIGAVAGIAALALFGLHFSTWTWPLVAAVVVLQYGLSAAYSYIHNVGGWKQSEFLPYGNEDAVSELEAERLETLWSWAGFATVVTASYVLFSHDNSVFFWAGEAFVMITLGFVFDRIGYRVQGLAVVILATAKLLVLDMHLGSPTWNPEMHIARECIADGLAALAASFWFVRAEVLIRRARRAAEQAATPVTDGTANGGRDGE
jgi:hypothetical protein